MIACCLSLQGKKKENTFTDTSSHNGLLDRTQLICRQKCPQNCSTAIIKWKGNVTSVKAKIDHKKIRGQFQMSTLIAESDSNLGFLSLPHIQAASPLPQFSVLSLASANITAKAESIWTEGICDTKSFLAAG